MLTRELFPAGAREQRSPRAAVGSAGDADTPARVHGSAKDKLTEEDRWDGQVKGHHAIAISWTKRGRPQRPGEAKVQDRLMGHTALLLRGIPLWSQCG